MRPQHAQLINERPNAQHLLARVRSLGYSVSVFQLGPSLHQMLSGVAESEREAAWKESEQALQQFDKNGGFEGPCEMIIAVGER
jgi:hypothetical protein